jgi:hypothetical protein
LEGGKEFMDGVYLSHFSGIPSVILFSCWCFVGGTTVWRAL